MQSLKRKSQTLKLNCQTFKARNNELWKKSKDLQIAMRIFKDTSTNSLQICRYTENSSDVCTIRFYIPRWKWRKCTLHKNDSIEKNQKIFYLNSMKQSTDWLLVKQIEIQKLCKNWIDSWWKTTQSDMLWAESIEHFLQ